MRIIALKMYTCCCCIMHIFDWLNVLSILTHHDLCILKCTAAIYQSSHMQIIFRVSIAYVLCICSTQTSENTVSITLQSFPFRSKFWAICQIPTGCQSVCTNAVSKIVHQNNLNNYRCVLSL